MSNCNKFVDNEFTFPDTQVLSFKPSYHNGNGTLTVNLIGRTIPHDSLMLAMTDKLPQYHLAGTKLK